MDDKNTCISFKRQAGIVCLFKLCVEPLNRESIIFLSDTHPEVDFGGYLRCGIEIYVKCTKFCQNLYEFHKFWGWVQTSRTLRMNLDRTLYFGIQL